MQIKYLHFPSITSTNTWAKEHCQDFDLDALTCITADEQTHGRGRMERAWMSPKETNLYLTLFFTLPSPCFFLANLAQLLSISCSKTLEDLGFYPKIKWPNDLLIEEKKVAGVLCEVISLQERLGIVLGVGVNVNMEIDKLKTINQPATSLKEIRGQFFPLDTVKNRILLYFQEHLPLLQKQGFTPFYSYYEERLLYKGSTCVWVQGTSTQKVICCGVDPIDGSLLVTLPSGAITKVLSGDLKKVSF